MKLFLLFTLLCVMIGIFFEKKTLKINMLALLGVCIFVSIGFFFFNQI